MKRLNNKNNLISATLISMFGSSMTSVALSLYVYSKTSRIFHISIILLLSYIPSLILGNISGNFIKKIGEKKAMIISDIINSILIILLTYFINNLSIIYLVAFFQGIMNLIFYPSRSSLVVDICTDKKDIIKLNSILSSIRSFCSILGPIIGTILITIYDAKSIFFIDGISFFLSALLILNIKTYKNPNITEQKTIKYFKIKDFIKLCNDNKLFLSIVSITFFNMIGFGIINVTLIDYCKKYANLTDSQYGLMISAYAIGALISSLIIYKLNINKNEIKILFLAIFLLGSSYIFLALIKKIYILLFIRFSIGFLTVVIDVLRESILQNNYDKSILPNIFSNLWAIGSAGSVLSILSVGILSDYINSNILIITAGVPFIVIVCLISIKRTFKQTV